MPVSSLDPGLHALLQEVWAPAGVPIQQPGATHTHQISLVLARELPRPAGALIVRDPGRGHDLVVLTERTATPAQLHAALGTLLSHRARHGYPVRAAHRIFVEPVEVPAYLGAAEAAAALERSAPGRSLAALREAPTREVAGFGMVRTLEYGAGPSPR